MLTVLGAVAQFEREMMLDRQREGMAKAKSEGRYKGRKPIKPDRRQSLIRLATEGATRTNIAARNWRGHCVPDSRSSEIRTPIAQPARPPTS